jgi:hypothetical protein
MNDKSDKMMGRSKLYQTLSYSTHSFSKAAHFYDFKEHENSRRRQVLFGFSGSS